MAVSQVGRSDVPENDRNALLLEIADRRDHVACDLLGLVESARNVGVGRDTTRVETRLIEEARPSAVLFRIRDAEGVLCSSP